MGYKKGRAYLMVNLRQDLFLIACPVYLVIIFFYGGRVASTLRMMGKHQRMKQGIRDS